MRPEESMIGEGLHVWTGMSGKKYRYSLYMFGTAFGPGPANFVFARETKPGQYAPIYFGQTSDLSEPFPDGLVMQCIKLSRVTHIHVHFSNASEEIRLAERSDLIEQWSSPCNQTR
jgi:hypothetical protein